MNEQLKSLLAFVCARARVCPKPSPWCKLWEMLPREGKPGSGPPPGLPIVLGGWYYSPDALKVLCFHEHVEWAAKQGVLTEVDAFLRGLPEEEWHHFGV